MCLSDKVVGILTQVSADDIHVDTLFNSSKGTELVCRNYFGINRRRCRPNLPYGRIIVLWFTTLMTCISMILAENLTLNLFYAK